MRQGDRGQAKHPIFLAGHRYYEQDKGNTYLIIKLSRNCT